MTSGDGDTWIYDGRDAIGFLRQNPDGCAAFLADGAALGTFPDRDLAITAICDTAHEKREAAK